MLSKKIELSVDDMTKVLELAKEQKLQLTFDKISCMEGCIARIMYANTRRGHEAMLHVMQAIHALELAAIRKTMPLLELDLLIPKKQKV